jgi:hypothetical protein
MKGVTDCVQARCAELHQGQQLLSWGNLGYCKAYNNESVGHSCKKDNLTKTWMGQKKIDIFKTISYHSDRYLGHLPKP